jgi:excisionase family DNA binding protein
MEQEQRWLTLKEAAAYIAVSRSFLRKHLRQLPHARAASKLLRFRRDDLDRWLGASGSCEEVACAERER